MEEKKSENSSLGYFKTRLPARPPERRLIVRRPSAWVALSVPLAGFALALALLISFSAGSVLMAGLSRPSFSFKSYQTVTSFPLPASVSFLTPTYDWSMARFDDASTGLVSGLMAIWSKVLGGFGRLFNPPAEEISPAVIEQLKLEILAELAIASTTATVSCPVASRGLTAVPSSGSTTQDRLIKANLLRMFADKVEVNFDEGGASGTITPILPDGRRGGDYVFVLTSLEPAL